MLDLVPRVGTHAPTLAFCEESRHRPRMLAFVRAWSPAPGEVALLGARLAELDAELVIVTAAGAWSIARDRELVACDAAGLAEAFGVTADGVFVIDARGILRFAHRPDRPLTAALTEALDAAGEALAWRDHQTQLERVQWTAREWALKCLVVGCALTFLTNPPPVDQRVFARGTGPFAKVGPHDLEDRA